MSTPTEIRAQAIALHAMGYSCRRIEKQLRTVFPGADIPRYCTISRWVRRRPTGWLSVLQWQDAYSRAGDILFERMEEMRAMPFDQMVKSWIRVEKGLDAVREIALGRCLITMKRKCAYCGAWFYPLVPVQRFCSVNLPPPSPSQ